MKISSFFKNNSNNAKYVINQFTCEYGDIICDGGREGNISDSVMFKIFGQDGGNIMVYFSQSTGELLSVSFNSFRNINFVKNSNLSISETTPLGLSVEIPEQKRDLNSLNAIEIKSEIEFIFNGIDTFAILFGEYNLTGKLNKKVGFCLDSQMHLSGFFVSDKLQYKNLMQKLIRKNDPSLMKLMEIMGD